MKCGERYVCVNKTNIKGKEFDEIYNIETREIDVGILRAKLKGEKTQTKSKIFKTKFYLLDAAPASLR